MKHLIENILLSFAVVFAVIGGGFIIIGLGHLLLVDVIGLHEAIAIPLSVNFAGAIVAGSAITFLERK